MNIKNIILVIIIIYLIIKVNIKKENFTLTNDDKSEIRNIIKDIYSTDLDAVRSLATMAKKIQDGGLTVNGDLNVTGRIAGNGINLKNNNGTFSHFPWSGNDTNYIRNNLTIDGATTINSNLEVTGSFNLLPKGCIIAFNSETAPSGWAICDGNNGTPDLRGKFIRMWNDNMTGFDGNGAKLFATDVKSTYNEAWHGTARGNKNGYVLKHKFGSYAGTDLYHQDWNEMPVHSHGYAYSGRWGGGNREDYNGGSHGWNGDWTSTGNAGSGYGATNQPPYYVLTFIMKL